MGPVLLAIAAALGGGASLWGYGWAARRLTGGPALSPPLTVALGLAAVLFIGGVLNLLRVAVPPALDLTAGAGFLLAGAAAAGRLRAGTPWPRPAAAGVAPALLLGAVAIFFGARLVPAQSFNLYDDFQKYFAYPVRMLATGTLGGNRLSALGAETLGGQAWLQGFVLAHCPPEYLGTVDAFFGALLCLFLAGFALGPSRSAGAAVGAQLAFLAINPQIVNVSSVYTGAALIMAACLLPAESEPSGLPAAQLGLIYAGLLALKTTFAAFVCLHLVALALPVGQRNRPHPAPLRPLLAAAAWTGGFLAPWLLLSAPLYRAALSSQRSHLPPMGREPFRFLSVAAEPYGATQLHYTALAGLALGAAVGAYVFGRKGRRGASWAAGAALLTAGGVYFGILGLMMPIFGRELATRYAGPVLVGAVPAGLLLWLSSRRAGERLPTWPIAGVVLALAAFAPSLLARLRQIDRFGTPLAFSQVVEDPHFIQYNRSVLHGDLRQRMARIQGLVPPGDGILAWVAAPFWLDYRRNPIVETNEAGLGARWARLPPPGYVLWQYQGDAIDYSPAKLHSAQAFSSRFFGANGIDRINMLAATQFGNYLEDRLHSSQILYNDGEMVLFYNGR